MADAPGDEADAPVDEAEAPGREAHPIERAVGVTRYVSDVEGTGGRLRDAPEEFRVRELEAVGLDPAPVDADQGDFAHLLVRVTLRGWDTNDFAGRLSDRLGISRERISWAGTKDKHAVTTQLFSLRGVDAGDLPSIRDADIEPVGRIGRSLTFGDLAGNAFAIRVRDAERPDVTDAVTDALADFAGDVPAVDPPEGLLELLAEAGDGRGEEATDGSDEMADKSDGAADESDGPTDASDGTAWDAGEWRTVAVPNCFGHQRFGSRRPVTHEVGLEVARGDWRGAVLAYVGSPAETEPTDTQAARAFVDEQAGSERPDWAAAIERFPGALGYERSMLHRLDERGADADAPPEDWRYALEAVPSNLQRLFVNAAQSYAFNLMLSERLARGLPFDRPVEGDVVAFADDDAPQGLPTPDTDRTQRVTAGRGDVIGRHCARGRAFVTAPLVGTDTDLAGGVPGEIERAVLDDLDLAPADFDLPDNFASRGTRRAIQLRTALRVDRPATESDASAGDRRFAFALPHGAYATTVLREYLKTDPRDM